MISGHYPATYGHQQAWLILVILSMGGVSVRHYFNIRHRDGNKAAWLMIALVLLSAAAWWARPQHPAAPGEQTGAVGIDAAWDIVQRRCTACHAEQPTYAGFNAPPLGVELDSVDKLRAQAERVYSVTVLNRTMPLANMTGMSEPERGQIALWFEALESGKATQEGEQ